LGDQDIQRVLVEGGPTTIHRFLDEGLVDEVFLVHAAIEHAEPVPSNISDHLLERAGLQKVQEIVWGEERVDVFRR